MASPRAATVYDKPLVYDIAFSFRDYGHEVDCLTAWYARASGTGTAPRSMIELACGPADHAIEFASRGTAAAALDLAPSMCEYAGQKAGLHGVSVDVHCADMTDFSLGRRYDLAALMINSVAHVYDVESMVRHLRSVAAHLVDHGVYVLEVQHPRDFVGRGARPSGTSQPWIVERFGLSVRTRWGTPEDPYDPVRQVFDAQVELRVHDGVREEVFHENVPMRDWGFGELQAAIALSGAFDLAELHGDFAPDAPFDGSDESWRMILVLRKRAA